MPTSSVPTRIATLITVIALSQWIGFSLIGLGSAVF
jgi:hypothetical protein